MVGFAVLDLETTGKNWRNNRILEIGIVLLDEQLREEHAVETLINPQMHIGAQDVHGIQAGWVLDAPCFEEFAPEFIDLLRGRTLVAHNASFDLHFTEEELRRIRPEWEFQWAQNGLVPGSLCTKKLSRHLFGVQAQSFGWLTKELNIENNLAHSALSDAQATSEVFRKIVESSEIALGEALSAGFAVLPEVESRTCKLVLRPIREETPQSRVHVLMDSLPLFSSESSSDAYLSALIGFIRDFELSEHQLRELTEVASLSALSADEVLKIHTQVFLSISAHFWDDESLCEFERVALVRVCEALGVPTELLKSTLIEAPGNAADGFDSPRLGATFVLTGFSEAKKKELTKSLEDLGHTVNSGVSKKVNYVVALDPDTLSGKGRRSRELGIPVLGEKFIQYLVDRSRR